MSGVPLPTNYVHKEASFDFEISNIQNVLGLADTRYHPQQAARDISVIQIDACKVIKLGGRFSTAGLALEHNRCYGGRGAENEGAKISG